jgi:hypothetical protein
VLLQPYIDDPIIVEAFVTWKVVKFSRDSGIQNIVLEGDVMEIVDGLWMNGQC